MTERTAGCDVCLDFRHLENLGPCPACEPDAADEHHEGNADPLAWRWSA